MKFILFVALLTNIFFSSWVLADQPLWMRKRNQALNFFRPESNLSYSFGKELYHRGEMVGFFPRDFVTWQGVSNKDYFFIFQNNCQVLNGFPAERCLRFNANLNFSSTLYLAWIFGQAYAQEVLYALAKKNLSHLNPPEQEVFLKDMEHFKEVDTYSQIYAMLWWHEINQHWNELSSRLTNLGYPQDHDYTLDQSHPEFSDVARNNQGSLNQIYQIFLTSLGTNGSDFIEYTEMRKYNLDPLSLTWDSYKHDPRYSPTLRLLAREFNQLLDRFQQTRP